MSYKNLMQTIKQVKEENTEDILYTKSFYNEFNKTLEEITRGEEEYSPSSYVRPSSLAGCKRMLYAMRTGQRKDEKIDPILAGINESGTDRHERIQRVIREMPNVEWLDVEKEVEKARLQGINTEFVGWDGAEARCKNDDIGIYFKCDGVIRYKNRKVLLEIKTENSYKWGSRNGHDEKHRLQMTAYAMGLGIDYVLVLYEDRNFTDKKLYLVEVKQEWKDEVYNKIEEVNNYVEQGLVPAKEEDKCSFCFYKRWCVEVG